MNKLFELFKSRKFWAALIGVALMVIKAVEPNFPLSEEQMTEVTYVIVAYILGTALEARQ